MSVIDRLNGSNGTASAPDTKGKRSGKKLAKREAKLLLKVEQARKDVAKAEGKMSKAQAKLDDSHRQLHDLEEKLAALRTPQQQANNHDSSQEQQQNPQDTHAPNSTIAEQQDQQEEQAEVQEGAGEQLSSDEGAVDTERASTPYSAFGDTLQSQESNPEQNQTQGQHSNTYFESRSDALEAGQDTDAAHQENQAATASDAEEQHPTPEPSDLPWQHNPTTDDK